MDMSFAKVIFSTFAIEIVYNSNAALSADTKSFLKRACKSENPLTVHKTEFPFALTFLFESRACGEKTWNSLSEENTATDVPLHINIPPSLVFEKHKFNAVAKERKGPLSLKLVCISTE